MICVKRNIKSKQNSFERDQRDEKEETQTSMTSARELKEASVSTLDLDFQGVPNTIASYLIPHRHGAVLVESGPGSTTGALQAALEQHGLRVEDISDVLLTHIHLDHAGAAGWLAKHGARIHVHPVGAPHLIDPEKLLSSAERIYGDTMETLWGDFLPVPEEQLNVLEDGQVLEIEGLCFRALDTPGHAEHHFAYIFDDICFTGDIGGVRLPGPPHIRLPMPPPEFNLEKWRQSAERLQEEFQQGHFRRIAPTHFGIFEDASWHMQALQRAIAEVEAWMEGILPQAPAVEDLNNTFLEWTQERSRREGVEEALMESYETANPSWMSGYGMQRYWKKFRNPS